MGIVRAMSLESNRIAQLVQLGILDTPVEEAFERITRIVSRVLQPDMTGISFVDENRVWFKSMHGAELIEVPRSHSFCTVTIQSSRPLVVNDARADDRFADIGIVAEAPHIRFYAGAPIVVTPDARVGAVCVFGKSPRDFDNEDSTFLVDMASTAAAILRNRLVHNLTR